MPWQEITDPDEMAAAEAMLSGGSGAGGGSQTGAVAPVMDRKSRLQLQATGLPVLSEARDPLARVTDPKQRAMTQRTLLTMGQKQIDKGSDDVKASQQRLAELGEFEAINQKGITGGFGGWVQSNLPAFMQTDDAQRVSQLSTGMARNSRIPGEGTISDFDAKMFQRMTGGLDKSQNANASYLSAAKAVQRANLDRQSFNEAFLTANGSMTGADTLWKQYSDANPMFDGKTGYVRQRRAWGDYFGGRAQTALGGGNPDAKPAATRAAVGTIAPSPAVAMLKKNPALAAQFDAKYGKGAAARILGARK